MVTSCKTEGGDDGRYQVNRAEQSVQGERQDKCSDALRQKRLHTAPNGTRLYLFVKLSYEL